MVFIKNLHSKRTSSEEKTLDYNQLQKGGCFKKIDGLNVLCLNDDIDISELVSSLNKAIKEKKELFIVHSGKKLFKLERFLLRILRSLKSSNVPFKVAGIPLCYLQDFLANSYDLDRYLFSKDDFTRYHYFEDCRFCRLRKVCPGALPRYEDQVFASFKEHFEGIDYSKQTARVYKVPKDIKKLRELFKRDEFLNLKLDEQKILLKNKDNELVNELFTGIARNKDIKDVFDTDLEVDSEIVTKLKDRNKYSYRTANKKWTGKKYVSFLVDVESCDQIVVFSKTFISSEIKELLRPDLVALVESRDYSNIELLRLLSHKISLYVREFSNFFYISTDPVALEYATDEEIEAKQISEQNLGSSSFEVEEV